MSTVFDCPFTLSLPIGDLRVGEHYNVQIGNRSIIGHWTGEITADRKIGFITLERQKMYVPLEDIKDFIPFQGADHPLR